MSYLKSKKYEIVPTETFKIIRNCSGCRCKNVFYNTNQIRMNANGKQIDVWLIYRCSKCKRTYNLPIYSRIYKDILEQSEFEALQKNNQEIVRRVGLDRSIFQKNNAKIYNEPSYILVSGEDSFEENMMQFSNPYKIRIRCDRLLAESLEISRTQAKELLRTGALKQVGSSESELIFQQVQ